MAIRIPDTLSIKKGVSGEPRLVLLDEDGRAMGGIAIRDLAEAIAPMLAASFAVKTEEDDHV